MVWYSPENKKQKLGAREGAREGREFGVECGRRKILCDKGSGMLNLLHIKSYKN